ncbi:hypothetical protein [Humibacillus xanthopallidus]|uniref:hypothetical protein n=1 Tax=Humibacillus xanthopallidus TaxID=412689 RepID=UPI001154D21D|nr:hypothetical protein [Humibacillus xanthopallidus]
MSASPSAPRIPEGGAGWTGADAADAVLGLAVVALEAARRAGALPLVGAPLRAAVKLPVEAARVARRQSWVRELLRLGDRERREALERADALARRVAPGLVDSVLGYVDVNELVRKHVDLDALAAELDVDAVVARADLEKAIDRVDIDGIVAGVDLQRIIDRIDVDAIVARADIQAVIDRVDVDSVVAKADLQKAIDRVDIDEVVAGVDLERIIDRIDVDAVVARADFDKVIAKLDLIELAEFVVEGIDLPGIIRSSTGSMASEGLREVRRQGIGADERVSHVVDRILRRQERSPGQPTPRDRGGAPVPAAPNGSDH